jgi:hypothetical protein
MKRSHIVLFFCLIFSASAFPQDRGVIQCSPAFDQVPAWTAPGGPYLVGYLSCDQMVSVTGLDRGYVRIQLGGHVAYVEAKYVRMTPTRGPRPSPTSFPRSFEPTIPAAEIFVGYSYLNFNAGLTTSRQSANGWEASVSGNFNRWLPWNRRSGYYRTTATFGNALGLPNVITISYYGLLLPCRAALPVWSVFVHALFGAIVYPEAPWELQQLRLDSPAPWAVGFNCP